MKGPEVAHRVGALDSPSHAALLETAADDRLAGRLHRPRANLPAMSAITRVVHFVPMVAEVTHMFAMGLASGAAMAVKVHCFQRPQHRLAPLVAKLVTASLHPLLAGFFVARIEFLGQLDQVLASMPEIQDHFCPRKPLTKDILQSGATVADGDLLLYVVEAYRSGVATKLQTHGLQIANCR